MRAWMLRARESFWFLPAVFSAVAIVLALLLAWLDRSIGDWTLLQVPLLGDLGPDGARAVLSAIGGTMLGVAATTFSITISVLATTSSTYGPRLVRNFMADRGNQFVLAVLTATFLYALVVLRSVHSGEGDEPGFVPVISLSVALALAILDVGCLVFFIHHIADSVQVATLQSRLRDEFVRAVERVYPDEPGPRRRRRAPDVSRTETDAAVETVTASRAGYVQGVDVERLAEIGRDLDVRIRIRAMPGAHVLSGEPIAEIEGAAPDAGDTRADSGHAARDDDAETVTRRIRQAFTLGTSRTPHLDVRFALQQLTEMGVRGLASGTNDPYTAVSAIQIAAEGLVEAARRPDPDDVVADADGTDRVWAPWPTAAVLVTDLVADVRRYGGDQPAVAEALLALAERLEAATDRPAVREAVSRQLVELRRSVDDALPDVDRDDLLPRLDAVVDRLERA